MEIDIRTADASDATNIVALVAELAANEGEDCPLTEAYVRHYLAMPGCTVLLAQQGEVVLGLLSCSLRPNLYHAGNSCLIEELVVTETARGLGVGSRLVSALLERLQESDCEEVSVSTLPDNHQAIKFYKKHGFVDEAVFLERHLRGSEE